MSDEAVYRTAPATPGLLTIEKFDVDQNNLELLEAMRLDKKVADDCGEAFSILVEICILKMQEELDVWTDKQGNAQDALKAYTVEKEELDVR